MRICLLALALLSTACHSTAYKIATYQNSHDFRMNRYHEKCGVPKTCADVAGVPWCAAACPPLNAEAKALHEAATALQWKGGMPLQIKALKDADAAAAKVIK